MTTSPIPSFISELESGEPLSEGTLAYFRERQRNRLHELVLEEFLKSGLSKADFARRIGRAPEQITRWLAAPGNWELDTISDFLLGTTGGEFQPSVSYPGRESAQDHSGPDWLSSSGQTTTERGQPSLEELLIPRETTRAVDYLDRSLIHQTAHHIALDIASEPIESERPTEPIASNDNAPYRNRRLEGSALKQVAGP